MNEYELLGLSIPGEKTMITCKQILASTHGTETSTFTNGAYLTDPLLFVKSVVVQNKLLAIGGDAGGGFTKLGITFIHDNVQRFAPLLVYYGKDSWEELIKLKLPNVTVFNGHSSQFCNIFEILQYLIDHCNGFLNGDWCFINTLLALKSPSSKHPCPVCIISSKRLACSARYRLPNDTISKHADRIPLITIDPSRIVPTPLHLFLGISNRIITDAYAELFDNESVIEMIESIRTVHSAGCGGLSDLHQLNGPEISKWIHRKCCSTLIELFESESITPDIKATHSILSRWLQQLNASLLHTNEWTIKDLETWRFIVDDIINHWFDETKINVFPKIHMLKHSLEFVERYRFLGRVSEAQIESFHFQFNVLYHKQHRNMSHNIAERLRRCLADAVLKIVQPVAIFEI